MVVVMVVIMIVIVVVTMVAHAVMAIPAFTTRAVATLVGDDTPRHHGK